MPAFSSYRLGGNFSISLIRDCHFLSLKNVLVLRFPETFILCDIALHQLDGRWSQKAHVEFCLMCCYLGSNRMEERTAVERFGVARHQPHNAAIMAWLILTAGRGCLSLGMIDANVGAKGGVESHLIKPVQRPC